jgi:hypothetical protein
MASPPERVSGACLCGDVRFSVELPSLFCAHCHCTMCQRNHGAAFVTWVGVPKDRLEVAAGRDTLVRYASSENGSRTFCGRCGTSLFCENTAHPERVDIPLANLREPIDRAPQVHAYWSDRVAWQPIQDDLPHLGAGGASRLEPPEGED